MLIILATALGSEDSTVKDKNDILFLINKARCKDTQPQYPGFEWRLLLSYHQHKRISFQRGFCHPGNINTSRYTHLLYVHCKNTRAIVKYGYKLKIEQCPQAGKLLACIQEIPG